MRVETTFSVDPRVRDTLTAAAKEAGVTRSALVVILLGRVMREHGRLAACWKAVRYQERALERKRCRMHVTLWARDYELCLDSRKFFKRSVSLLVVFAVENYLEEVLGYNGNDNNGRMTDNYTFSSYLLICNTIGDSIIWHIYWNIPPKPAEILPN